MTEDRDTLIRVEQQLKDSVQNQTLIMSDLKEIFQRLETESKLITTISGDIRGHLETSKVRWEELGKKITSIDKTLEDTNGKVIYNEDLIRKEIDDRKDIISKDQKERAEFEQGIKASGRIFKWIFGTVSTIAAFLAGLVAVSQLLPGK